MRQKIAVVAYTIDPEKNIRFLMRHNKPFNGYDDEWTVTFGGVEDGESLKQAAIRELEEEFSIKEIETCLDLNYEIIFESNKGTTCINFFAIKLKDIDIQINLNEESIGYDWMRLEDAINIMKHNDEKEALKMTSKLALINL